MQRQASDIEQLAINTIRTLSMDAVEKANSGHPGTPMALAPLAYTLWQNYLKYDPQDPLWPDRDRFVLSAGHASMLLYSTLFLAGVQAVDSKYERMGQPAISLEDIKNFRQLGSKTPGHPEYHMVSGVETTTGPLGQGVSTSVGMAIAERWLAEHFNRPEFPVFDHRTYVIASDGDLMEGVASEAASIAGHLKLSRLCWFWDHNRISIEGSTELAFTENVGARFKSYGWNVHHVKDVNDLTAMGNAIEAFRKTSEDPNAGPTFIIVETKIGFGAPHKQGTKEAHGEPLGEEEIRGAKRAYGWNENEKFVVPAGVVEHFKQGVGQRGQKAHESWKKLFENYSKQFPKEAREILQMQRRELPEGWDKDLPVFPADAKGVATRDSSGKVMNAIAKNFPWFLGGSADLAPSTKTRLTFPEAGDLEPGSPGGRNLHFGIREHAMGAIVNGLALSKIRPYGSTFLIFSDYQRPAIRLSSLMELPAIHIFTHDSVGLGEDGPTHQPIEQLPSLRAIPGLITVRPADANEVTECWRAIIPLKHRPVALCLSRQKLPTLDRTNLGPASGAVRGAYVLADAPGGNPEVILMATGSEVHLALEAHAKILKEGIRSRVVSMPSWELFDEQEEAYRNQVLPPSVTARVSIELASTFGWHRYLGSHGVPVGMTSFGASAPLEELLKHFGFTTEHVVKAAKESLKRSRA